MSTADIVIKNGTIVTSETSYKADVAIQSEKIVALGENLSGTREIDATGKLVTPGAIDVHVHLEMPIGDFVSADSFFTGTRAAAIGGTTAIVDFVETQPDETMLTALAVRQKKAAKSVIDYGFHMTICPTDINKLDQLPAVYQAGCASFKLYMAYGLRLDDGQILQALEAVRNVGGMPVVHAENWEVITSMIARNLDAGRIEPRWHPRSRPSIMEGEAAGRVINIATLVGTPLYIFHVSCAEVVNRIAAACQDGLPIYGETCPQYLFLTDTAYDEADVEGALPVCSPPLRTPADQVHLWEALAQNSLQVVSTDHCPFTRAEKATGLEDYSRIPGGVPSIEMRFPAMYTFGVQSGYFSVNRWVDICCTTPARLFGFQRKGHIAVGYDADVVIFDPNCEVELSTDSLHEDVDWTPYDGLVMTGWPAMTLSRGELIVEDGCFVGQPGRGRFVTRRLT
ncbi:dihydropyrimidinase [Anaerolineales bacterium HSG25]|nr:dihydropyrimidinase [Anaerolineales bacterium HSG25]